MVKRTKSFSLHEQHSSNISFFFLGSDHGDNRQTTLYRSGFNGLPSAVETNEDREAYEQQANEMTEELWRLYQDHEGWADEARSQDGKDVVTSKTFPNRGKVFRLTVSLEMMKILAMQWIC